MIMLNFCDPVFVNVVKLRKNMQKISGIDDCHILAQLQAMYE